MTDGAITNRGKTLAKWSIPVTGPEIAKVMDDMIRRTGDAIGNAYGEAYNRWGVSPFDIKIDTEYKETDDGNFVVFHLTPISDYVLED